MIVAVGNGVSVDVLVVVGSNVSVTVGVTVGKLVGVCVASDVVVGVTAPPIVIVTT